MSDRYVGVSQAAALMGRSEATIIRWYDRGVFANAKNAKGERVFRVADLDLLKEFMRGRKRLRKARPFLASPAAGRETMEARYSETLDATNLADPRDLLADLAAAESR